MKALSAFVLLSLALTACGDSATQATQVDAATASNLIEDNPDLLILDIRTPEEVANGTLPEATVIDFYSPTFQQEIDALDRTASYLVYCRSGSRSAQATTLMADMGFAEIYELEGGLLAWINSGRDLSSDS